MNPGIRRLTILIGTLAVLVIPATAAVFAQRKAPEAGTVVLVSPVSCPAAGCAAGQRISLRVDYDLVSPTTQAQVCVYTPANWDSSLFEVDPLGGLTGNEYAPGLPASPNVANCGDTPPAGYALVGGALGTFPAGQFGDSLGFSLRIGSAATASGSVLVRVLESADALAYNQTLQVFRAIPIVQANTDAFAANEPSGCGSSAPCYVDSGGDAADGISTGLKDALDAAPADGIVTVLGSYTVKANTITVTRPVTLRGINDASLTTRGTGCFTPLLRLSAGITVTDLNLSDGPCPTPGRDLIEVDNPGIDPITIQSSDLTGGRNAIVVTRQTGLLTVQYNHISGNSAFALQAAGGSGPLSLVANNLAGNQAGAQVSCTGLTDPQVDHNFWGAAVLPATAAPDCAANPARRLGAPALQRTGAPGVDAVRVAVKTTRTEILPGLAAQRTDGASDLDMYAVNHGSGANENIPFFGVGSEAPSPCGNFMDLFAADGAELPTALDLFFKYDASSGCQATIASTIYCDQADPARFPLYWLDPALPGAGWITTASGTTGQTTACLLPSNEIQVTIDDSGRPSLADLGFIPFVVGLPRTPTAIVFSQFAGIPGDGQILVQWQTTSELNTSGFYLTRLNELAGAYQRISGLIPSRGTSVSGASYELLDTALTNGNTYYYKLEVVNLDLTSLWTGAITAVPNAPTPTPTITPIPTATPTITPTGSPVVTDTPTFTPAGSATVTPTGLATVTPSFPTATRTRTRTAVIFATATRTPFSTNSSTTITPAGSATITRTFTPTGSATITQTITPTGSVTVTRTITPTATRTRTRTQIVYTFSTATRTRTRTAVILPTSSTRTPPVTFRTATSSGSGGYPVGTAPAGTTVTQDASGGAGGYPALTADPTSLAGTLTANAGEPGAGTGTLTSGSRTPPALGQLPTNTRAADGSTTTPTAPAGTTGSGGRANPQAVFWLSLSLGGLLGVGSLLAGGWYLFLRRSGQ